MRDARLRPGEPLSAARVNRVGLALFGGASLSSRHLRGATTGRRMELDVAPHATMPAFSVFGVRPTVAHETDRLARGVMARPGDSLVLPATNGQLEIARTDARALVQLIGVGEPRRLRCDADLLPSVGDLCGPSIDEYVVRRDRRCSWVCVGRPDENDVAWIVCGPPRQNLVGKVVSTIPPLGTGVITVLMRDTLVDPDGLLDAAWTSPLPVYNTTETRADVGLTVRVAPVTGLGLRLENPCICS